jgi:hypothetical protein
MTGPELKLVAPRLHDPQAGKACIDGCAIRRFSLLYASLHARRFADLDEPAASPAERRTEPR